MRAEMSLSHLPRRRPSDSADLLRVMPGCDRAWIGVYMGRYFGAMGIEDLKTACMADAIVGRAGSGKYAKLNRTEYNQCCHFSEKAKDGVKVPHSVWIVALSCLIEIIVCPMSRLPYEAGSSLPLSISVL